MTAQGDVPCELCVHAVHLRDGPLHLRPMTEDDWPALLRWNNDPEVLHYSEGGDVTSWSLADMQAMYRHVSRSAYVFIIELDGAPIGECWLQETNLERVRRAHPGLDVRRIDIMIGERRLWGRGWGSRAIALLARFAFEEVGADLLYEPEVADYNERSLRAFARHGFVRARTIAYPPGGKARVGYDLALDRCRYERLRGASAEKGKAGKTS